MLCIEAGVDDCLLSQKGKLMCFFQGCCWVRGKIMQDVTCLVCCLCAHLYMYMCVNRKIWSGSDEAGHMLRGREYILQHTLVCMHSTLIENKASFSQGQWHTNNAHLRLTMLQIETMKGQRTNAYTAHKVLQWYFFWILEPGCFQTRCCCRGRYFDIKAGQLSGYHSASFSTASLLNLAKIWLLLNAVQVLRMKWLLHFRTFIGRLERKPESTPPPHRDLVEPSLYFCALLWAILLLWWPITVEWMLVMKQTPQASTHVHESLYNGAFVEANMHMCCVVNLCQLCVAVPLTSDHCDGAKAGCCLEDGGAWRSLRAGTS